MRNYSSVNDPAERFRTSLLFICICTGTIRLACSLVAHLDRDQEQNEDSAKKGEEFVFTVKYMDIDLFFRPYRWLCQSCSKSHL